MLLAHRIRLDPTPGQRDYFARAAGTARRVWNWALAEWQRQLAAGGKPNAMALKKQFNAIKYASPDWLDADGQPWLRTIHRDAHAQPFAHLANARLSRAIADVGFYEFRRQLQYKAARYGTRIVLAERWYPSSKLCSGCGARNADLSLDQRVWTCTSCGAHHDRDVNAAINLERLATGALAAATALPAASQVATLGTAAGMGPAGGGKVTPVRYEHGQQDGSGQEENGEHICPRFR